MTSRDLGDRTGLRYRSVHDKTVRESLWNDALQREDADAAIESLSEDSSIAIAVPRGFTGHPMEILGVPGGSQGVPRVPGGSLGGPRGVPGGIPGGVLGVPGAWDSLGSLGSFLALRSQPRRWRQERDLVRI